MEADERFQKLSNDPRFQKMKKKHTKVKIDPRFEKMFTDERFHTKVSLDKRGKPLAKEEQEDLEKFYEIASDEEKKDQKDSKEPEEKENTTVKKDVKNEKSKKKKEKNKSEIDFSDIRGTQLNDASSSDEEPMKKPPTVIEGGKPPMVEDDSTDDEFPDDVEEGIIHGWGELDEDARRVENAESARLAVCNCDWDKINATDLFVMLNSFKPTGGNIISVCVYPSDFGLERMKEEELNGPKELQQEDEEEDEENAEGSKYHMEKLRQYQLNRMKYYYAVVVCDSKETADKIYTECDSLEYEMSATRLDLRFIPDEASFDDRQPKSTCTQMPNINTYQPAEFTNTALQQSSVRLTWDETDPKRVASTMKQFTSQDIDDMDFKDYLASSSSEEDEPVNGDKPVNGDNNEDKGDNSAKGDNEKGDRDNGDEGDNEDVGDDSDDEELKDEKIKKYRLLMQEIEAKEKSEENEGNMEVTWDTGLTQVGEKMIEEKDKQKKTRESFKEEEVEEKGLDEDFQEDGSEGEEELGFDDPFFNNKETSKKKKMKVKDDIEMTEEEKKRKAELELIMMDETEDKKHFNMKAILKQEKAGKKKKKRKNKEIVEDDFQLDVKDPRFNALYTSHLFSIDPSEPTFKKTKANTAIIEETQKRRAENNKLIVANDETKKDGLDPSLSTLVNSIKTKTKKHETKKKKLKS